MWELSVRSAKSRSIDVTVAGVVKVFACLCECVRVRVQVRECAFARVRSRARVRVCYNESVCLLKRLCQRECGV